MFSSLSAQQTAKTIYFDNFPYSMGYLEHLPPGYGDSDKKFPVLIFLHGSGEIGNGQAWELERLKAWGPPAHINNGHDMCFTIDGVKECFIVVSPQSNGVLGWSFFVSLLIDHLLTGADQYKIDLDRIYLTGLSNGGQGVYEYAAGTQNEPNMLAAIAPIAARASDFYDGCKISRKKIPVWAFHGLRDTVIPHAYGLNAFSEIEFCMDPSPTASLTFTTYEDRYHDSWIPAYDTTHTYHSPNLYEWLLRQRRQQVVTHVETTHDKAFSVYPNPLRGDRLFVEYDEEEVSRTITILNAGGSKVSELVNSTEVDTSAWPAGIYTIHMIDQKGKVTAHRVAKIQ